MTVTEALPNTREDSRDITELSISERVSILAAPPAESSIDTAQQARRMRSAGHGLHDIASALRVHPEQVRRWLAGIDHDEAATVHARAWRAGP